MAQKRRRPIRVPLIGTTDADATSLGGRTIQYLVGERQLNVSHLLSDYLFTREDVRQDLAQVFVNRNSEDSFVVSFHFPSAGRSRQVRFAVPAIRYWLTRLRPSATDQSPDDEPAFTEQALADFEQLWVNFVHSGLLVFCESAASLAALNLKQRSNLPQRTTVPQPPLAYDDGREEYIVNVDKGWPLLRPRFKLFDVVRLTPAEAERDLKSGYLVRGKDAEENEKAYGPEYRQALIDDAELRRAEAIADLHRPAPTDVETFLVTSEGRKICERIVKLFGEVVGLIFPPSPGRPLARTPTEEAKLIDELREDFKQRRVKRIADGDEPTKDAIYQEMADQGRYGSPAEALTAPTIKYLIGREAPPSERPRKRQPRPKRKR